MIEPDPIVWDLCRCGEMVTIGYNACEDCGMCERCHDEAECLAAQGLTESARAAQHKADMLDYYDGGPKPRGA